MKLIYTSNIHYTSSNFSILANYPSVGPYISPFNGFYSLNICSLLTSSSHTFLGISLPLSQFTNLCYNSLPLYDQIFATSTCYTGHSLLHCNLHLFFTHSSLISSLHTFIILQGLFPFIFPFFPTLCHLQYLA